MIASHWLSAGPHKIEIKRGGISLHAGNGDGIDPFNRTIGPLVIMPARLASRSCTTPSVSNCLGYAGPRRLVRWLEVTRPA